LILALVALAAAHVPHNDMQAVATDGDLGDSVPWVSLHEYGDATMVFRSDDRGATWSTVGTEAASDVLDLAGWTSSGRLVLAGGNDRFWWSSDLVGWSEVALPSEPTGLAVLGDDLLFAGDDGLVVATTGGSVDEVASGAGFSNPNAGPGGFSAVGADGDIWYQRDGDAFVAVTPPFDATAAAWDGAVLYAGDRSGELWRFVAGEWSACGVSPWPDAEEPQVRQLVIDGASLWMTNATYGPALSTNGCTTWESRISPLTTLYVGSGSADGPDQSSMGLRVAGDSLVQVGWSGLAFSNDAGVSWTEVPVLPPDFTRGIGISPDYATDGRMAFGSYSGGVVLTDGRGETWSAPNVDLEDPNVQDVEFSEQSGGPTLAVVNHFAWRSADGGTTWESVDVPMSLIGAFHGTADGRLWVTGLGASSPVMVSDDLGANWEDVSGLTAAGCTFPLFTLHSTESGSFCGTETENLFCSDDGGTTWRLQYGGDGTVEGFTEYGGHWIVAEDVRGVVVDDVVTLEPGGDPPHILSGTDDGHTVVMVTRSGAIWRSDDAGMTWQDLGLRTTAPVRGLLAVPKYAFNHQFILATYDGVFVLDDSGLTRFGGYERVDVATDWVESAGTTTASSSVAAFGSQSLLGVGSTIRTSLRGEVVSVVGSSDGASIATISIDGGAPLEFGTETSGYGTLVTVNGLGAGWHDIVVEGTLGSGLYVDGVEGQTPSGALPYRTQGDTGETGDDSGGDSDSAGDSDTGTEPPRSRCKGCGSKSAAAMVLFTVLVPLARRRRT